MDARSLNCIFKNPGGCRGESASVKCGGKEDIVPTQELASIMDSIPDMGRRQDLLGALQESGGWRGLFDPCCHAWGRTDVDSKMALLAQILRETGLTMVRVVYAFQEYYGNNRPDVVEAVPLALSLMLGAALSRCERTGSPDPSQRRPE